MKPTIGDIEKQTKRFADKHEALVLLVRELNENLESVKRAHLPAIKKAVGATAEEQCALSTLIEYGSELFEKPRTVVFHGIKVGLQKGKGGIEIVDEEKTIELIEKHLTRSQVEILIHTEKSVVKKAVGELSVDDLKRIGCHVLNADDFVVIKPTDSDVDKVVAALLKGANADA